MGNHLNAKPLLQIFYMGSNKPWVIMHLSYIDHSLIHSVIFKQQRKGLQILYNMCLNIFHRDESLTVVIYCCLH